MTTPAYTYAPGSLSDGQLPSSVGSIYTATGVVAYVQNITLFNNSATPQTIIVYILRSGSTRRGYRQFQLAQDESADVMQGGKTVILSPGDAIQAITTTATEVDYVVYGVTAK